MRLDLPPLEILVWPHPALEIALPIDEAPISQREIDQLLFTMSYNLGVGLAANQVGLKRRVFVMRVPSGIERVFINPRMTACSDETEVATEGCLSLPGQFYPVARHLYLDLTCNDQGKLHTIQLDGLEARVAQHEMDHLNGIVLSRGENVRLL